MAKGQKKSNKEVRKPKAAKAVKTASLGPPVKDKPVAMTTLDN